MSAILVSPALVLNSRGQNYVGMNESEIVKNMDKSMSGFIRQRGIVNERWNYLKYESGDGLQTLLFFMDNSGRCFEMRLNFDKSLYSEKVRYNDDNYVRVSENRWRDRRGRSDYSITLTDDDWFYTLRIRETKK